MDTYKVDVNLFVLTPLQLVILKNIVFSGVTNIIVTKDLDYVDVSVRVIMVRYFEMNKKFKEAEFGKKSERV